MISEQKQLATYCSLPPVHGTPTDWSNLYSALMVANKLRSNNTTQNKTIITLDLQLYSKCIQMQSRDEIDRQFVFRMGELHIVFAFLKCIGKFIDNSRLDERFVESGIYGPQTLEQIKGGKHMKRSFEAYLTLFIALYELYLEKLASFYPEIENLRNASNQIAEKISNSRNSNRKEVKEGHEQMFHQIENVDLLSRQKSFDSCLRNQSKFLRNFMKMFEKLLLFIRSSRQSIWNLHLSSICELTKHFFAFDLQNYARLTPVYIAQMSSLKVSDVEEWTFLQDNMSVNKTHIPFSAIGPDHPIEHENRAMKVRGGIKGIANYESTLDKRFLILPEMNQLNTTFCDMFNVTSKKRDEHYQLMGSLSKRMSDNKAKLKYLLVLHNSNFEDCEHLFNVVTKTVSDTKSADQFLSCEEEGKKLLTNYVEERINGTRSIWEPIPRRNLPTFAESIKKSMVKLQEKTITLKEERKLLTRLTIASRQRPEINLAFYIGNFEFSAVPRSLFARDGSMHVSSDKSVVIHEIEKMAENKELEKEASSTNNEGVIIFDGMAIVQKTGNLKTCSDFAKVFIDILINESRGYKQIRLIFDRYMKHSLKEQTREKRTKGKAVHFKISDDTKIENYSMKVFLSHIRTKKN